MSLDQFREALRRDKIEPGWLEDQIRTEIAWGMLVNRKFRSSIIVTDADIDAAERRLREDVGKTEYRLAEIFLSVDDPNETGDGARVGRTADRAAQEGLRFRRDGAPVLAVGDGQQRRRPRLGLARRPAAGDRDGRAEPAAGRRSPVRSAARAASTS